MACLEVSCEAIWYNGDWAKALFETCFTDLGSFEKWLVFKYDPKKTLFHVS